MKPLDVEFMRRIHKMVKEMMILIIRLVMMVIMNIVISPDIEFIRLKNLPNGLSHHPHKFLMTRMIIIQ